ncbi:MAG: mRNA surveillance protein pelota [Candidatus Micrarchaeia archaeon]|jgi:mRNA surveillance protein pelota
MKIIRFDRKEGVIKVEPQSVEDLWYLAKIIGEGDFVEGRSFRRFKPEGATQASSGEKKPVRVEVRVEKTEFAEQANKLRVTGKIVAGEPEEYCPHGDYHTLEVEPRQTITVKKKFGAYEEALLDEAMKQSQHVKALIIAMDEEKAVSAQLRTTGIKFGAEYYCHANKRDPSSFEEKQKHFFSEIAAALKEAGQDSHLVVAGPGFTKDAFKKYLTEKNPALAKKILWEHADSAERTAVYSLLKQGTLEKLLGEQKLQTEFAALEKLKASIGRGDGLSVYGLSETREAAASGAVAELLVLDELVRKNEEAREVMELARKNGAKILVFNSEDDAGAEFKAFKIAALLRYKTY